MKDKQRRADQAKTASNNASGIKLTAAMLGKWKKNVITRKQDI